MKKPAFYTELSYFLGIIILASGTAFMERADLGMSMVVAPAYILHLKLSETMPFYTFGMSEYVLQAVLLIFLSLVLRRFKRSYLFSFVTAVLYGFALDGALLLAAFLPCTGLALRILYYVIGTLMGAVSIALLFHTYFTPEAYELFVKEIADRTGKEISRVKTVYDIASLLVSVLLSFLFFGLWHFEGVKIGTLITALTNGFLIGKVGTWLDRTFDFKDALPFQKVFLS